MASSSKNHVDGIETVSVIGNDKKPREDMEFETLDDIYKMYNEYAKEVGFCVRKYKSLKRLGEPYMKYFSRSKEGSYKPGAKSEKKNKYRNERFECNAKVIARRIPNTSKWVISQFVEEHNHELTTPRRANGTSKKSYAFYGDVIVFDTTHKTNKYDIKFAPFVGVNNHGQTIAFACAFLTHETIESFRWCFEAFKEAMLGSPPIMMITDLDTAIANALYHPK
ncbi:hypothetical protein Dsin_018988 [Dipteronia sinensis]|uniref:Protein FAR1-RELATED SEQUENCE n=1 Tax=Dipteronia sinensis TaxID=43782 RepID=A0AAE0E230_9ROSI|nr:hypothetical protein Dsin_018988 [Dipteronia sinensis]